VNLIARTLESQIALLSLLYAVGQKIETLAE